MKLFLIAGKAQSGKDTFGNCLQRSILQLNTVKYPQIHKFAEKIKYIAKESFHWNDEKDAKGRKLLQDIGTIGRAYNENIWAEYTLTSIKDIGTLFDIVPIITDWRYSNEYNFLQNTGIFDIIKIRIEGRGGLDGDAGKHESENSLPEYPTDYYDYIIWNNCIIQELEEKARKIVNKEFGK